MAGDIPGRETNGWIGRRMARAHSLAAQIQRRRNFFDSFFGSTTSAAFAIRAIIGTWYLTENGSKAMARVQQSSKGSVQVQQSGKGGSRNTAKPRKSVSAAIAGADAEVNQRHVDRASTISNPDVRHRLISEVAYRFYAERGYVDGHDLDDWLRAEVALDLH
jgi:hypothetical protein